MNKVILIGRLTKDPERKSTNSGLSFCNFTVAVNRLYKSTTGGQDVDFINCIAWRTTAENLAKYMTKGGQICVEGQIQVRNYTDNNGVKRYATDVLVESIEYLSRASNEGTSHQASNEENQANTYYQKPTESDQFANQEPKIEDVFREPTISNLDLPF